MSVCSRNRCRQIQGAHAFRVLVSASRRNNLSIARRYSWVEDAFSKVRDRVDAFASTRDACAPQTIHRRSSARILQRWVSLYCEFR